MDADGDLSKIDFKYKLIEVRRETEDVRYADASEEQRENLSAFSASQKRPFSKPSASDVLVKKVKKADAASQKGISAPLTTGLVEKTASRFSQKQHNSSGCRLFTERTLDQHVLRYLHVKNIAEELERLFGTTFHLVQTKHGTCFLELSGSCDQRTIASIERAILQKLNSCEQNSFKLSYQQCSKLNRLPNRIVIAELREFKVWAGWFVDEATSTLHICSDTTQDVEQAHRIIMQLGGLDSESASTRLPMSPQSKHPCEEHFLRYLSAKRVTADLSNKHNVQIEISLERYCWEVKGAPKNVESATAEMQGILNDLVSTKITLLPEELAQWPSLNPQTILSKLELRGIIAGWSCRGGLLQICSEDRVNATTAKLVLQRLLKDDFCEKLRTETENLQLLKASKATRHVKQKFKVDVNINIEYGVVEVVGVGSKVSEAIEKLNDVMGTYVKNSYDKEPIFLKCLKSMTKKHVTRALSSSKVAAGWDVRNNQLIVCAETECNVTKAAQTITELVTVSEYTHDNLSQAQAHAGWPALVRKLSKDNVHVEFDEGTSRLRYAMAACDEAAVVTNRLKIFLDPLQQKSYTGNISEKIKALLNLNKNIIEANCPVDGKHPVSFHVTDDSYQLTSNSQKSLEEARLYVDTAIIGCTTKKRRVKTHALVNWMKTPAGRKRLAETCSLSNATFALNFKSVKVEELMPAMERLRVDDVDISTLQLDGVLTGRGVLQSAMERVCGAKIKPGAQQVTNLTTAHSCNVYHIELQDWCGAASLKVLRREVQAAMTAFSASGLKRVALPAVGTGSLKYPCTDVANTMVSTVEEFFLSNPQTSVLEVTFVAYQSPEMIAAFTSAVADTKAASPPQNKQEAEVTFTALTTADVNRAMNRLKTDLDELLLVETWDNDPLRSSISHLTPQMVAQIKGEGGRKNVEVLLDKKTNSIRLKGLKYGVRSVREQINKLLHQLKGDQIPTNWSTDASNAGQLLVQVNSTSTEYRQVAASFTASSSIANIRIIEISRVQNIELHKMYEVWKEKVTKQVAPGVTVERSLWHGTDAGSVQSICQNEFNRSFAGKNGVAYGKGSYFATSAHYSIGYSKDTGDKYIIRAKVVTGKHTVGNNRTDRSNLPAECHSTTDSQSNPSIFVVYNDASAYPEYVIKFRC